MTGLRQDIARLYRAELGQEVTAGLPTLRRIPSTRVVRFFDYLTGLDAAEQAALLEAMAWFASVIAEPEKAPAEATERQQNPAIARMNAALAFRGLGGGYRYTPIKILSGVARDKANGGLDGWFKNCKFSELEMRPPQDLLPHPYKVEPVKPARLKRLLDKALQALFAPQTTKAGSELTQYAGVFEGWKLTVTAIFAPSGRVNPRQLEYFVKVASADPGDGLLTGGGTYEALWSFNATWDYITQENAERSIDLLKDLIVYLTRLTDRVNGLGSRGT